MTRMYSFFLMGFLFILANPSAYAVSDISFTQVPTINNMTVGETQSATYTIKNNLPLTVNLPSISVINNGDSMPADTVIRNNNVPNNCGGSLGKGASCNVGVTIAPTQDGTVNRTLRIKVNTRQGKLDSGINLSVAGISQVSISLNNDPSSIRLQYRQIIVNNNTQATSVYQNTTVSNNLSNLVHVCATSDSQCDNDLQSTCSNGQMLTSGQSCVVWIKSLDTTQTGETSGTVTVNTSTNSASFNTTYNMYLYLGGDFTDPAQFIAKWDGAIFSSISSGNPNFPILSFGIYNGNLVAGGAFSTIGGVTAKGIALWNGSTWAPLGSGLDNSGGVLARALSYTIFNNNLIVDGIFDSAGGNSANNIAQWNGSNWSALSSGLNAKGSALTTFGGNVIAGGAFSQAGGISNTRRIAAWDGSVWSPLGTGMDGPVLCETTFGGSLIAGGQFVFAGGNPASHVASWNGSAWTAMGNGLNADVNTFTTFFNKLIAGGNFTGSGIVATNRIAQWNGSSWSALGLGMDNTVWALGLYGSKLIAGGDFFQAGGVPVNRLAQWDGASWSDLSTGANGTIFALLSASALIMTS